MKSLYHSTRLGIFKCKGEDCSYCFGLSCSESDKRYSLKGAYRRQKELAD